MACRRFGVAGCFLVLLLALPPLRAAEEEETPPPPAEPGKEEPKGEEAPKEAAEAQKKVHWWGDRFALYVEASLGSSSFEDLGSSIETAPGVFSANSITLDDNTYGNVTVGWMFPFNRGKALVSWTGYKEDSYTFRARGMLTQVVSPSPTLPSSLLDWWDMTVEGGRLEAVRTPPLWDPVLDDLNRNGRPEPEEVRYEGANLTVVRGAPDNLQNRVQTLDLLYQRDFGGRRVGGRWTGGLRHFRYQGNLPAAAWILLGSSAGSGWTDGVLNRVLAVSQDTAGVGPTGSLQAQAHFFRRRLTIYGRGRVAFVLQSLEADTGNFNTLVRDGISGVLYAAPARLLHKLDKSAWHVGAEIGIGVELVKGLQLEVAYDRTGYQDAVLLPTSISIPGTIQQAPQGTVALYNTQDITADSWRVGFGYQF